MLSDCEPHSECQDELEKQETEIGVHAHRKGYQLHGKSVVVPASPVDGPTTPNHILLYGIANRSAQDGTKGTLLKNAYLSAES